MQNRRRMNTKPPQGNNRFGRTGVRRCTHCRKARQKVFNSISLWLTVSVSMSARGSVHVVTNVEYRHFNVSKPTARQGNERTPRTNCSLPPPQSRPTFLRHGFRRIDMCGLGLYLNNWTCLSLDHRWWKDWQCWWIVEFSLGWGTTICIEGWKNCVIFEN